MAPTRKDLLEKSVWSWADKTDPKCITKENLLTAYRVQFPRCKSGSCRRNCRGNPYCLSGLGEPNLNDASREFASQELEKEKRADGLFVGLKNLGATCYVNSLLQLWFHNPFFRSAIFDWDPLNDPDEMDNTSLKDENKYVPQSVVGHLQQLFSLLKFSRCRYIDPTQFVEALGLDTGTQQDAQEFSKLFISLLENRLSYQILPHVRDLIINNFQGKYSYVTRCCKCQTESVSPSLFYELELHLKGHHTLGDCLDDFLKEEKLDGANCYHCTVCNEKQEALRFINLETLPPVLNLQLLRFVYDRQKGYKKKINSTLEFPLTLDMGKYFISKPSKPCLYNLSAVLIHKGVSANSGHYVAHIQNSLSNEWYMFNDENVQKKEGNKLELSEDDEEKTQKGKKRLLKDHLRSNNAYMLVYTAENYNPSNTPEKPLNSRLEKYVEHQNKTFNDWYDDIVLNKKVGTEKKEEKLAMHSSMSVLENTELKDIDVISLEWLSYWLQNTEHTVKPISNAKLLCSHSCLSPDQVTNCKYVVAEKALELYDLFNGGPRLRGEKVFCKRCVSAKCLILHTKAKTLEESKQISSLLKQKMDPKDCGYLVDKKSLQSWRKRVLEELDENPGTTDDNQKVSSGEEEELCTDKCVKEKLDEATEDSSSKTDSKEMDKRKEGETESDESDEDEGGFNEALACIHGNLSVDESSRRVVSTAVWKILSNYFPEAPTFKSNTIPCRECQNLASEQHIVQEQYKTQASVQKKELKDLLVNRNRPQLGKVNKLYLLPNEEFYEPWKKFVRSDGKKCIPPASLGIKEMLCHHGLFKYSMEFEEDQSKVMPVTRQEWEMLKKFYPTKDEVIINNKFVTKPDFCQACFLTRLEDEQKALLDYERAKVFIRFTSAQLQIPHVIVEESESSDGGNQIKRPKMNGTSSSASGKNNSANSDNKKKEQKGKNKRPCINGKEPALPSVTANSNDIRRSSRRRKAPGEKEVSFVVSSTNTLRELKFKIMNLWQVPPYDQHLCTLEGRELSDDQSTLAALNLYPNSVLLLRVDEPSADAESMDDLIENVQPEAGFKGTELLRNL